jgi:flagellar protein FlaG
MDVYGANYAPLPPMPGSGEFAPAPTSNPAGVPIPAQPAAPTPEPRPVESSGDRDSLRRAVDEINSSIAIHRRHLGIRFHEPTNRRIVTVYDSDTNDILREIPPESVLTAHANMLEMVGLFMDTRG